MTLCLVTGGGGFIGSHISRRLCAQGYQVRIFDNGSTGDKSRLEEAQGAVEWIDGDIRDFDHVSAAAKNAEVIFHFAAVASVQQCISNPLETHSVNVTGTAHVLQAAVQNNVRRVLFASSSAVYGDAPISPKHEAMHPAPISPYAVHKLAGEYYCSVWSRLYGLETVLLRYFNVFGPSQNPKGAYSAVIPKFIMAALQDQPPEVYGDGAQSRDFIHIDNVTDINLLAAFSPIFCGKTINVGSGEAITLNQLIHFIGAYLQTPIQPIYQRARSGDIKESLADITLLQSLTPNLSTQSFQSGLEQTIAWYRERIHNYQDVR